MGLTQTAEISAYQAVTDLLGKKGRRDYSQIELLILAHVSGDEALLDSFDRNEDVHTRTAAEVFGVTLELVSEKMRRAAKAINFGIAYSPPTGCHNASTYPATRSRGCRLSWRRSMRRSCLPRRSPGFCR